MENVFASNMWDFESEQLMMIGGTIVSAAMAWKCNDEVFGEHECRKPNICTDGGGVWYLQTTHEIFSCLRSGEVAGAQMVNATNHYRFGCLAPSVNPLEYLISTGGHVWGLAFDVCLFCEFVNGDFGSGIYGGGDIVYVACYLQRLSDIGDGFKILWAEYKFENSLKRFNNRYIRKSIA